MKYIEERCSNCNDITVHRVFRRFGQKNGSTGAKRLKRTVTWCVECQKRVIRK